MKKLVVLFFFIGMFFNGNSQSPVYDQGKNRQLHSMVYSRWSKRYFRPKWYYKLIHNKYRKGPDRRYILQLAPALISERLNNEQTEDQESDVDKDFKDELLEDLDKRVNTKYNLLYKDIIDELYENMTSIDIENSLLALEDYHENNTIISEHIENVEMFRERQKNISESYRPSFEKNSEYNILIKDMREYVALLYKIKDRLRVVNKYKEYFINKEIEK